MKSVFCMKPKALWPSAVNASSTFIAMSALFSVWLLELGVLASPVLLGEEPTCRCVRPWLSCFEPWSLCQQKKSRLKMGSTTLANKVIKAMLSGCHIFAVHLSNWLTIWKVKHTHKHTTQVVIYCVSFYAQCLEVK